MLFFSSSLWSGHAESQVEFQLSVFHKGPGTGCPVCHCVWAGPVLSRRSVNVFHKMLLWIIGANLLYSFRVSDFLGRTEIRLAEIKKDQGSKGPITKRLLLHEVPTGEIVVRLDLQLFEEPWISGWLDWPLTDVWFGSERWAGLDWAGPHHSCGQIQVILFRGTTFYSLFIYKGAGKMFS